MTLILVIKSLKIIYFYIFYTWSLLILKKCSKKQLSS